MDGSKIRNMEEFASVSGISRPTVSKYFNDPNSVRQSTRERIEAAIEKYDYRPNIFAMNQNRQLTKNVGIVVPYLADPFFAEIARNLERRCIDAGFSPILFSSHGVPDYETDILEGLRSLKPAGVLLAPLGRVSNRLKIEEFCAAVPTVLFDSNLQGIGEAFVGSDNFSFVAQTVDYLMRTGEAPCFFEMRTPANPNANKRRLAYIEIMEKAGAEPRIVKVEGNDWNFEEIGRQGTLRVLEAEGFPGDTILCSNDRLAIGLLSACYEKGLRIGREEGCDLRVASMDDHPFSRFTCPSLTTAAHDYDAVANKTFNTLIELIEAGGRFNKRTETLYSARLVMRSSA
ncbi:LacI family DNA-binding transcriptional regulator [Hoeflea prorocentri]|uniref:LacI family DNA-binding transcriptional regulator n=2 Tax=Hoeflea prorocentri TaxID=1922333 RepID=A0A9X3UJQ6_9HYPH|nr:LacI family DNA-binding transcriptional regulator [Hoeflea prorocentri]MCY6382075.1 LacI family DNA-binding transcriptional regulator [Hoeflea prorocentri]MDA5399875.1 LacI family DNA-binding transcriptional regulator [Hoeflea prorocentri]